MITKSMTYRRPISGCAAVECSDGKTLMVEHRPGLPAVASGTIIDRLREYEEIGTPEYFRKLANKDRIEKIYRITGNSNYGKMLTPMEMIEAENFNKKKQEFMCYVDTDIATTNTLWEKVNPHLKKDKPALPEIDHVIFNNPATIVFWKDDTKTVVKANNGEPYDPEKGLAMAMVKKVSGNKGNYYNTIRKELDKNPYDNSEVCHVKDYANMYHCLKQCERNVNDAYDTLRVILQCKKATKADLIKAIESAVGDLGELLDDGGPASE